MFVQQTMDWSADTIKGIVSYTMELLFIRSNQVLILTSYSGQIMQSTKYMLTK